MLKDPSSNYATWFLPCCAVKLVGRQDKWYRMVVNAVSTCSKIHAAVNFQQQAIAFRNDYQAQSLKSLQ